MNLDDHDVDARRRERQWLVRGRLRAQWVERLLAFVFLVQWALDARSQVQHPSMLFVLNTVTCGMWLMMWWKGPREAATPWVLRRECSGSFQARRVR